MSDQLPKCGLCGKAMKYNAPAFGASAGFVHSDTNAFECGEPIYPKESYSIEYPDSTNDPFDSATINTHSYSITYDDMNTKKLQDDLQKIVEEESKRPISFEEAKNQYIKAHSEKYLKETMLKSIGTLDKELQSMHDLYKETNEERVDWRECATRMFNALGNVIKKYKNITIEDYDLYYHVCKAVQEYTKMHKKWIDPIEKAAKREKNLLDRR